VLRHLSQREFWNKSCHAKLSPGKQVDFPACAATLADGAGAAFMKRSLFGVVALGLVLILLGAGSFSTIIFIRDFISDPSAYHAALAACREKGWHDKDLACRSSIVRSGWAAKTAKVKFKAKGQNEPKTIRVTLHKSLPLRVGWYVVDYIEIPDKP
jgi:hypothetical protein